MKKKISIYTFVLFCMSMLIFTSACTHVNKSWLPCHASITPSVEWSIQEGVPLETRPQISSTLDWEF